MKKLVFFVCVLSILLSGMVFAAGGQAGSGSRSTGPMYTESELRNFRITPNQIPQSKLNTTLYMAVSIRGVDNPYLATIYEGMRMFSTYLDGIGQRHTIQLLDSGGSNEREVANMRAFAARAGGNAIAYSDPNENAIAEALALSMSHSGGYIGTAWNKPGDVGPMDYTPNWVLHTSPNNVTSGYDIAKALFDHMGGSGEVFVIRGMDGNTAAIDRFTGFERALREYPGIRVVANDTGNWATAEALRLTETWLTANPNVGGIWCANDNMATGALQALANRGMRGRVGVVGIDANTDIVEAVRDGIAVATVSSNGFLQAGYTLAVTYAVWAGLLDPHRMPRNYREFATPSVLITSQNAAQWLSSAPTFDFANVFYWKAD